MKQAETRQLWKDRVAAYRASGESASKWCASHQLSTCQLWYWLRRMNNIEATVTTPSRWVTVHVDKQPVQIEATLLVKVGSAAIEVRQGYDSALLSDIVKTLQSIC